MFNNRVRCQVLQHYTAKTTLLKKKNNDNKCYIYLYQTAKKERADNCIVRNEDWNGNIYGLYLSGIRTAKKRNT